MNNPDIFPEFLPGTVWLVGMMGAGKSTVGPALARRLARRFVDTDLEIEHAAGRSVAEIFADDGEDAFRARERTAIATWAGREVVAALGGGAPAQPGVRDRLERSGVVVYLRAATETLERASIAVLCSAMRLATAGSITSRNGIG